MQVAELWGTLTLPSRPPRTRGEDWESAEECERRESQVWCCQMKSEQFAATDFLCIKKERKLNQLCACHKLMLEQFPKQLCVCAYAHACSLTGKKRVGARQARLVGGIPPTQPPQAAAALLHLHQGGVMNAREVLATPRRVTLAAHTHALEKKHTEIRFENGRESEGHRKGQWEGECW